MIATKTFREITGQPKTIDLLSERDRRQLLADGYARGGPSNFGITERGIRGFFYEPLDMLSTDHPNWARQVGLWVPNSNVLVEKHRWLGAVPQPREHVGTRDAQPLNNFSFDVTNRDFELSMPISLHDWKRDQIGQLRRKGSEFAGSWEDHWLVLAIETMINNDICYDGVALYSASHSSGSSGTQKNELTATEVPALNVTTPAAPTPEEAAKIMSGMSNYMLTYKDDQGRPTNQSAKRFLFLVPTAIADPFEQAARLPLYSGGGSNTLSGLAREFIVVSEPRITDGKIYVFILDRQESGALILQQEEDPMVYVLGPGSEHTIKEKEVLYLSDASRTVKPGQWRHTARGTLS